MPTPPLLCDARTSLLLVVDIQERLLQTLQDTPRQRMLRNTGILLQSAHALNIPVIATEQYPQGLGALASEISEQLDQHSLRVEKTTFSCCGAGPFPDSIRASGATQIIVAGMETHVCILQTVIELLDDGLQVFLASDAVASRATWNYKNALQRLRDAGATISNTESIIFEWLRDSKHDQFRHISRLIR